MSTIGSADLALTDLTIERGELLPIEAIPFHRWRSADGEDWLLFYRDAGGYLLRFPAVADFKLGSAGQLRRVLAAADASRATVEHLYLNQVQPLAQSRQRCLVLHASAVEVDGHAVLFLGQSGMGKSTLATAFVKAGYRFLADDGVTILESDGQLSVLPGHASLRLWDDARDYLLPGSEYSVSRAAFSPKTRILAADSVRHCDEALPFAALFVLGEGKVAGPLILPAPPQQMVHALLQHCFLLDIEERDMLRHHFGLLGSLTRKGRISMLDYPREFHCLGDVVNTVVRSLHMGVGTGAKTGAGTVSP